MAEFQLTCHACQYGLWSEDTVHNATEPEIFPNHLHNEGQLSEVRILHLTAKMTHWRSVPLKASLSCTLTGETALRPAPELREGREDKEIFGGAIKAAYAVVERQRVRKGISTRIVVLKEGRGEGHLHPS